MKQIWLFARSLTRPTRVMVAFLLLITISSPVWSVTYYISSKSGNDASTGLSHQQAWRSLDAIARRGLSIGDDVLLESGTVFEDQQISIDWAGSASNPAILGCYVAPTLGPLRRCGVADPKPEINGTFESDCLKTSTCLLDSPNSVPSTTWGALVRIASDHVVVENLKIKDSAGVPIYVVGNGKVISAFQIENLLIDHSVRFVVLAQNVKSGRISGVEGKNYNLCDRYKLSTCSNPGWPGGITVVDSIGASVLVEHSYVHEGFGEGFNCLRSTHVVFRGNKAGATHSSGYYLDHCSNTIVENNIAFGDRSGVWSRGDSFSGVAVGTEDYGYNEVGSNNNVIRNNLVVGYGSCIWFSQFANSRNKGAKIGAAVYGNSCAAQNVQAVFIASSVGLNNIDRIDIANNLFINDPSAHDICASPSSARIAFSNNAWPTVQAISTCNSSGDVIGDPGVITTMANFRQMGVARIPTARDFALKPSSPLLAAGKQVANVPSSIASSLFNSMPLGKNDKCNLPQNSEGLAIDYFCASRSSPPTIGALDRSKYPPQPPIVIAN